MTAIDMDSATMVTTATDTSIVRERKQLMVVIVPVSDSGAETIGGAAWNPQATIGSRRGSRVRRPSPSRGVPAGFRLRAGRGFGRSRRAGTGSRSVH